MAFALGAGTPASSDDDDVVDDALSLPSSLGYCNPNSDSVVHSISVKRAADNNKHRIVDARHF